ncbi:MAG: MFS transporter [Armatimonadota bacterium]|nr:MFS transporter [Armatimonadota bacterium]
MSRASGRPPAPAPRAALRFVVLLGVVSLFADATYEGARSITGPYLGLLGASAATVGVVAGLGELIGYGLRLASGYLADRTRRYWAITVVGYAVNLGAVPLLALVGHWPIAAALIVAERVGKALRTPARDAMLSHATQQMGRGWGFGVHEALDQVGAVLGPLVVAGVVLTRSSYRLGFAVLAIPAALALAVLVVARFLYPRPRDLETAAPRLEAAGLRRPFWVYLAGMALVGAGYADFPLIAFHLGQRAVAPAAAIPVLYAVAMGVDALAALIFGRLFDRHGLPVLTVAVLVSALFAPLVFLGGFAAAAAGMVLWGVGMGAQESIMRAAVAGMAPPDRRGAAYGIFNTGYGLCWFLGSAAMGLLYGVSTAGLVLFSVAAQLAAIPLLLWVGRVMRGAR